MTGFGAAARAWPGESATVSVEVRSVNARFLELKVRQPFGMRHDQPLRRRVEAALGRGRIDAIVHLQRAAGDDDDALAGLGVDRSRLRQVLVAAGEVRDAGVEQKLELRDPSTLEVLRFLQGARPGSAAVDPTVVAPGFLLELVDEAVRALVAFRETEGAALTQTLTDLAAGLRAQVEALAALVPAESERIRDKLAERIAQLCTRAAVEPPEAARIAQEAAIVAARGDVAEEVARLRSHLDQVGEVLGTGAHKGQGKTLEFLAQELLREMTTIGSKITSHEGSRIVIDAKGTIEQIREQVQNVE